MRVTMVDPAAADWNAEIDRIGALLGAPDNPTLFPYHFLQVVLPRLGGRLMWVDDRHSGVGFLFPRRDSAPIDPPQSASRRAYTLRYHPLDRERPVEIDSLLSAVAARLDHAPVVFYDPTADQQYTESHRRVSGLDIGRPSHAEAQRIRHLQREVWASPTEFLYPADIHAPAFGLGASLVARVDGECAGFLFGFYKFDSSPLPADWSQRWRGSDRLESQMMGVLPRYRGMRIGTLLKRVQGEQARAEGIGVVNWTADPLQFANAVLNFGSLRAMAFDFLPDLYPFRNQLNRVHASRFKLTWLVGSDRVRSIPLTGARASVVDLRQQPEIERINQGWMSVNYTVAAPHIAVEIPANWTSLQEDDLTEAMAWREVTDRIFSHYVGQEPGKYVITGVGSDGLHRYLIGERVSEGLWQRLGR